MNLSEILTERLAIVGGTGSGKSYTARGLVEKVLATKHGRVGSPSSDLAQRAGYSSSSSTWRNILSRLRTLGLIEGSRNIKLHEDLR